jgi:hypothetical protein
LTAAQRTLLKYVIDSGRYGVQARSTKIEVDDLPLGAQFAWAVHDGALHIRSRGWIAEDRYPTSSSLPR